VRIDEPGRDNLPLGIHCLPRLPGNFPERRNQAIPHSNVTAISRRAAAVHYRSVHYFQI